MKLEIEVSDELMRDYIEQYVKHNLSGSYVGLNIRNFLDEQTKKALAKAFNLSEFPEIIENACKEIALAEIKKSAARKVPGWVQNQIKEMLKYASARFWEDKK
jgi:hypothetical protein